MDEIQCCDHSNQISLTGLLHGTIYFSLVYKMKFEIFPERDNKTAVNRWVSVFLCLPYDPTPSLYINAFITPRDNADLGSANSQSLFLQKCCLCLFTW